MKEEYSVGVIKDLEAKAGEYSLHRPMRVDRYEEGTRLTYRIRSVGGKASGIVTLVVEKFVGGGFAGQVYRVKIIDVDAENGVIGRIEKGNIYAIKILIPPSGFSLIFRNVLYFVGFQGPFQLQVNPAAARAGALWQKFIRRGAKIRFGSERAVVDIHATFVDETLGSCGELSEWVDGRVWDLEVDDRLDWLKKWRKGEDVHESMLGSPEYREKYTFMHEFVSLLHDMGGHEFARQYEWSTAKSQPNCLKRNEEDGKLVAVDFRAGLALLPFLPMSPGDFGLIIKGIRRGSLVQFDRGNLATLSEFIKNHSEHFEDMTYMLDELAASDKIYRNSIPDITHNHVRLLYSRNLWSTILGSAVTGWRVKNSIDEKGAKTLSKSSVLTILFILIGLIPFLGRFFRKLFLHGRWRNHYISVLKSLEYFRRAIKVKMIEKIIAWHRAGRVNENGVEKLLESNIFFFFHFPFSFFPAGLHRIITDPGYAKERLDYLLIRPFRLYFNAELREEWLRDMVVEGEEKNILSKEDSRIILSRIKEPFIQKYLKSLAVHVCTLPVTQVVSVVVAFAYVAMHPEMPRAQAWAVGLGIIALFQVVPISPGSLVRGLYVLYLVIRERNYRDYNIAVFLGFFKYIGYLAFPIQMAYRYPVLARFMAAHWARESVHFVPVFGESGALLEHWVYRLFYNRPLTLRRKIVSRMEKRKTMKVRHWHIPILTAVATGIFVTADYTYLASYGVLPALKDIWWMAVAVPFLICGSSVTLGFGGASMGKRIVGAILCGAITGILYAGASFLFGAAASDLLAEGVWRVFVFSMASAVGAIITEIVQ